MVVGRRNCWKISRRGSYINVSLPSVPYARRRHRRRGTPRRAPPRPKRPAGQAAGSGGTRRHRAAQPRRAARHGPEPPPHLRLPPPGAAAARPGAPAPQGGLGGASAFCLSPAGGRRQLPALSAAAGSCPSGSASRAAPGALVPRWAPARGVRSGRRWAGREGPRSARLGGSRGASASPGLLPGAEALRGDGGGAGQRSACSLLRGRPRGLPSEPHIRLQKSSKFCSRWHKARTSSGAAEQAFL